MVLMEDGIQKKDCLTVEEAAKELSVGRTSIENYIRALQINKRKFLFDKKAYISKSDVELIRRTREGQ